MTYLLDLVASIDWRVLAAKLLLVLALSILFGLFVYLLPRRAQDLIFANADGEWAAVLAGGLGIAILVLL